MDLMANMVTGAAVTALAILFKKTVVIEGTKHKFTKYDTDKFWQLEILPDWDICQPYQNLRDGIRGDKRGWYNNKKGDTKWHKWWWNAIRNPLNTQKRLYDAVDISRCRTWVAEGYLQHVDEDSETTWGEKLIYARDVDTDEIYTSYESMKPLYILGWFTGYCVRRLEGYKFDFGEEKIPFTNTHFPMTYDYYKGLCEQYAKDGYKTGQAMINLDRLAPLTGRKKWMFTLKKIK